MKSKGKKQKKVHNVANFIYVDSYKNMRNKHKEKNNNFFCKKNTTKFFGKPIKERGCSYMTRSIFT